MVLSFTRRLFCLLLTSTLTVCCLALDGDGRITVSFSIWSPPRMDLDLVEDAVLAALQTFFCRDTNLILLDSNVRNVCYQRGMEGETNIFASMTRLSILDFIQQTDPIRSYLASEIEKASASNATDNMIFMEDRVQQRLDVSIANGLMHQRMRDTGITIGKFGQEWENYSETPMIFEEENINADPELHYKQAAVILRYIGIVMLIGNMSFSIALTIMGRRYRIEKDRREKVATRQSAEQRGLVTEQGVNLMLDIGRRASERMSSTEVSLPA
eukprot:jgi/Psemu1/183908/e_gw1.35.138.1